MMNAGKVCSQMIFRAGPLHFIPPQLRLLSNLKTRESNVPSSGRDETITLLGPFERADI
jgi:hypothetical protein